MAKNYYVILGVSSDASQDEIKSAYRREAKRCHPDRSGEGSEPFLDIREAYEVLGDPARRRDYDREMAGDEKGSRSGRRGVGPEPLRRGRYRAEPLVPERRPRGSQEAFVESPLTSLLAELFGGWWDDVDAAAGRNAGRRPEEIHVEVTLSQKAARRGGRIRVRVPALSRCPACRGRGGDGFFACAYCSGRGAVPDERPVDVALPGGLVDGFTGRVSLGRAGMGDLTLVLHVRVDDQV